MNIYSTVDNPKKSMGQNHFGFLLHADKRREQQLLRKAEILQNYRTISEIPSYFSELNTSIPTSFN